MRRSALSSLLFVIVFVSAASGFAQSPIVVGYLPQWGMYGTPPWSAKQLVTSGSAALLNQIDYSQAAIVNGQCALADRRADLDQPYTAATSVDGSADAAGSAFRGELHQLQELHRRYPRIRMLISIEGKPTAFADAAQPAKRAAFVASCIQIFLRGELAQGVHAPGLFTGIDVDWEYPNGPDGPGGSDGANYNALLQEFRRQLDAYAEEAQERPMLTIAVAPGLRRYPGVDWALVSRTVDQVGLMTYDYNGPWQKTTGMVAPLYAVRGLEAESGNVDATVQEYRGAGVPAAKMLLGVPFYSYQWTKVAPTGLGGLQHGLGAQGQPVPGDTHYSVVAALPAGKPGSGKVFRDAHSQAPWIYDGSNFWSFDDPVSASAKAKYTHAQGLGGVMVWHLGQDTTDGALLKAISRGLGTLP